MKIVIISSEEEGQSAIREAEAEGYRLAAVSNVGLPRGQYRLTFLPASSFADEKAQEEFQP